ncbi:MAG: type II secretion system F family protein, partial [Candidatus Omnitrophota bacterium]
GLFPIKVVEARPVILKKEYVYVKSRLSVSSSQLLDFTRQVYNLLCAHVELLRIIHILGEQTDSPKLRQVISHIYEEVKEGKNFSSSLESFPYIFPPIYISLVKAGEKSGRLDLSFERITLFLEQKQDLRRRVTSSLAYPVMMILVGIGTMVVLVTFVIPRLSFIFVDLGQELPMITRILLSVSSLFNKIWFWLAGTGIVIAIAIYQRFSHQKLSFQNIVKTLPILRKISYLESITHFSYSFGILLASGVSILDALNISRLSLGDTRLSAEVDSLRARVTEGSSLAQAVICLKSFPKFFSRMLVIGEESGLLPDVMNTTTSVLMKELDLRLKVLSSLIEPIIILVVGLILGIMVIAMLLPILQMSQLAM